MEKIQQLKSKVFKIRIGQMDANSIANEENSDMSRKIQDLTKQIIQKIEGWESKGLFIKKLQI